MIEINDSDILAAQFVRYNANSAGHSSPDCVKRALSYAFNVPYVEMSKELIAKMKACHSQYWNIPSVYGKVIQDHGGTKAISAPEDGITLNEFIDKYASEGTYLVEVNDKASAAASNHIVCVADGKIYDSWNSLPTYVFDYYKIGNIDHHVSEYNAADHLKEIVEKAQPYITEETTKLWNKYGFSGTADITNISFSGYSLHYTFNVKFDANEYAKARSYTFQYSYVFTPQTEESEIDKILKETTKVRLYDRYYAINKEELKLKEQYEIKSAAGDAESKNLNWLDNREQRFFNSLPGWARGLATYLSIYEPGQFYDSYEFKIRKLPQDDIHPDLQTITFEGYTANQLKDELKRYHDKLELPYDDYDPAEDY